MITFLHFCYNRSCYSEFNDHCHGTMSLGWSWQLRRSPSPSSPSLSKSPTSILSSRSLVSYIPDLIINIGDSIWAQVVGVNKGEADLVSICQVRNLKDSGLVSILYIYIIIIYTYAYILKRSTLYYFLQALHWTSPNPLFAQVALNHHIKEYLFHTNTDIASFPPIITKHLSLSHCIHHVEPFLCQVGLALRPGLASCQLT